MLKNGTKRTKIIRAALRLAQEKGWRALTLEEIAKGAHVDLTDLHKRFTGKTAILEAFSRRVDRAVLEKVKPAKDDTARDRLFDVLMTRFEVLAPYKGALKRIAADMRVSPSLAASLCGASARSQYWMLTAAGIGADGREAALRIPGVMAVYAGVLPIWLEDDDPGLARTMAALDRRLRRGERALNIAEQVCGTAERLLCAFVPRRRGGSASGTDVPPEPAPSPEASRVG